MSFLIVTTIEGYTPREIERAAQARKLYRDLSAENVRDLKVWLRSNQCKNVHISADNVNLSEKIYKADVAALKGKSVRPYPPLVTTDSIVELTTKLMKKGRQLEPYY